MISIEETFKKLNDISKQCSFDDIGFEYYAYPEDEVEEVIGKIYNSIGSCGECEYYAGEDVMLYNCEENEIWVRQDFFCADFKRK